MQRFDIFGCFTEDKQLIIGLMHESYELKNALDTLIATASIKGIHEINSFALAGIQEGLKTIHSKLTDLASAEIRNTQIEIIKTRLQEIEKCQKYAEILSAY